MRKTMATVVVLGLVWIGYTAWPPGEAPPVRGELRRAPAGRVIRVPRRAHLDPGHDAASGKAHLAQWL